MAYALATLSGALYATGFPPWSWTFAPWVALAPLLVACARLSPGRAAVAGMGWTAAAAVVLAAFVPSMLARFFGLSAAWSWAATLLIVAGLHGAWVGAYAAWVSWLARRGAAHPLLLAGGWVACELGRSHGPLGAPWGLAAYSQVGWPPVIQIADLGGPHAIGWMIALVNACMAAVVAPALRGRRPRVEAGAVAVLIAGTLLYGHWRLRQSFADGPPVRVAVVQAGAPAVGEAARAARLARHVALAAEAGAAADLVVWPEHAVEAYLEEASPARDAVLRLGGAGRPDLILGGPHFETSAAGTTYHNSAYLVRGGRLAARYDKRRLVPFAEDGGAGAGGAGHAAVYTPGSGPAVLPATPARAGMLLCLESMFPDLARQAVRQGAEILVNLSNDAWFGGPPAARHQLDIAALRAVETRRYLVRAAATGFSAVIDPLGRPLARSGFDTPEALRATVYAATGASPYQRWGDAMAWLVVAGVVFGSLRAAARAPAPNH